MQGTCVNGVTLKTSLLEFGERRSESRLILQRNAVDGAQQRLLAQPCHSLASVSQPLAKQSCQRNEQSPGVERRLANQVLAGLRRLPSLMPAKK